jgi:hypothetical protein
MQGRNQNRTASRRQVVVVLLAMGCGEAGPRPPEVPVEAPGPAATGFDPATSATLRGQVLWRGETPQAPPFRYRLAQLTGDAVSEKRVRENPNAPQIDDRTGGVANAVVYLRGVDPKRGKSWDLPPVCVEQRDQRLSVRQGAARSPFGFVRRGDRVEMVSRDTLFHSLHAQGAAFFTLAFPDADRPRTRRLGTQGVVELTSAAGYFWMRAYLFVDDHPYYARTDAEGRFALEQVPPGSYQVVCWVPNWSVARHERDPESGVVTRLFFSPPLEATRQVTLEPRQGRVVQFTLSADAFPH